MKKLYCIFALLITATLFIACQNAKGVTKADDMGKFAFEILKKLDHTSKDDYLKIILTIEEIKEFGENNADKIGERGKKQIDNLTAEDYNARMEGDFMRVKEEAEKYGIVWNEIEYSDYTYETKEEDNMIGTRGNLLFKYNDTTYSIRVAALLIDDIYTLIRLDRLNKN